MAFNQEIADRICTLLVESDDSLRTICKAEGIRIGMILEWANSVPEFALQYARARAIKLDAMAEDLMEIADTPQMGEIRTVKADGSEEVKKADMIEHRRLRVDSRKWYLSKLAPKKFGDKLGLTDGDGGPLTVVVRKLSEGA